MIRSRSISSFLNSRQGTGTVEFVLSIPLFLVALAFAYELGQFLLAHQNVVNNVHAAARYLSRTACLDEHEERAKNIIRTGRIDGDSEVPWMTIGPAGGLCQDDGAGALRVHIDVLADFQFSIGFPGSGPSIPFRVKEDLPVAGL
jgi:Flp pilus assembly protein TadG